MRKVSFEGQKYLCSSVVNKEVQIDNFIVEFTHLYPPNE